jgi:hypothetical protein
MCLVLHGLGRSDAEALEVPSHRGFELAALGDDLACLGIGIDTCDDDVLVGASRCFDGLQRAQCRLVPNCPDGGDRALLGVAHRGTTLQHPYCGF